MCDAQIRHPFHSNNYVKCNKPIVYNNPTGNPYYIVKNLCYVHAPGSTFVQNKMKEDERIKKQGNHEI